MWLYIMFLLGTVPYCIAGLQKRQEISTMETKITLDGLMRHLREFQTIADNNGKNRQIGSKGYTATMNYIERFLVSRQYSVSRQPVTVYVEQAIIARRDWAMVKREDGSTHEFLVNMTHNSPFTASEGLHAKVVHQGDGCKPQSMATIRAEPWISLVSEGDCSYNIIQQLARDNGAHAVLVYENGEVVKNEAHKHVRRRLSKRVNDLPPIATVSMATAESLMLMQPPPMLHLHMKRDVVALKTENLIAESPSGDSRNVVMLGAHADSSGISPGINDNAAGMAILLEIADNLLQNSTNKVRFGFFAAAELDNQGARTYINSLSFSARKLIAAFLNTETNASKNYANRVYDGSGSVSATTEKIVNGSDVIQKAFQEYFANYGLAYSKLSLTEVYKTDCVVMADRDIPFGGLSAGNDRSKTQADVDIFGGKVGQPIDPCYQKSCDTLDNVNGDILVRQARAYAAITERFAKSVQDIRAKQQN